MKRLTVYYYGIVGAKGAFNSLNEARKMYRYYTELGNYWRSRALGAANMCPNHKCIYRENALNGKRTYFKP